MASNRMADGHTLTWTNTTGTAVVSGEPIDLGTRVGVALVDIADGETGTLAITGVWLLPKQGGLTLDQNTFVGIESSGVITSAPGNTGAGLVHVDAAGVDDNVEVLLLGGLGQT